MCGSSLPGEAPRAAWSPGRSPRLPGIKVGGKHRPSSPVLCKLHVLPAEDLVAEVTTCSGGSAPSAALVGGSAGAGDSSGRAGLSVIYFTGLH